MCAGSNINKNGHISCCKLAEKDYLNWFAFSHFNHLGLISLVCETEKVHRAPFR